MASILIRKVKHRQNWRRPCEDGGRDWSDASISQGMPKTGSSHQKLAETSKDSPLEPLERIWPC